MRSLIHVLATTISLMSCQQAFSQDIPDDEYTNMKVGGSVRAIFAMTGLKPEKISVCEYEMASPTGPYRIDFRKFDDIVAEKIPNTSEYFDAKLVGNSNEFFIQNLDGGMKISYSTNFILSGSHKRDYLRIYGMLADIVEICNPAATYKPCTTARYDNDMKCIR